MWSFRKELHKISGIGAVTAIPCDQAIQFTGNQGIFIFDINIGTELGNVNLNHDAFGVPDRFQIEYDGVIVADSLYVGNSLTGNPPDLGGGFVGNTYNNVPEFFWDGTQFVANGNTQNLNITQLDVAPFGSTAGSGTISFQKITSTPAVMTVKVFAPLGGTAWNLDTECPDLVGIGCNEMLSFSSDDQAGTYYTNVELGLDTGLVTLDYEAGNIPDRFQIMYDGVIVADTLLVGGYLTGNPPDADTALWEGGAGSGQFVGHVYNNIPDYEWDGAAFVASGPTTNNTVLQTDVAPFGQTAGAGTISFVKPNALPSSMTVIVTSFPSNTGWSFDPNCPVPIPDSILLDTTSVLNNWQASSVVKSGSALTWDVTGGIVNNQVGDNPIFDFSLNAGTANVTVSPSTNITTFAVPSLDITTIDVSNAPNLTTFICAINSLNTLDVTNNILLGTFDCSSNNLNTLDVTQNTALVNLAVQNNSLTNLDITNNTLLTNVSCDGNVLVAVDIDNIIIQLDTNGLSNGFLDIPVGRTAASDAAKTSLQGKGWTVNEI